ncbi:hypothetical protein D915_000761 [Fasciola hepatica]|uniref:MAM domain-containing protein n=1 Tax=Fasciola hepatica TaxID=6192 RepID=A0A4E0RKQ4_FASHE|nr:hypothetical protein D915_000761 [Fasciola hepatica]
MRFVLGLLLSLLCVHAEIAIVPTPTHVCNFSSGTCGWSNDQNSWKYRWQLIRNEHALLHEEHAMCLLAKPIDSNSDGPSDSLSWFDEPDNVDNEDRMDLLDGPVQSRLWSPLIRKKHRLGCIQFAYSLVLQSVSSDQLKADSSPKPVHTCTFTTDTCGWSNDQNSWFHRWELFQSTTSNRLQNEKVHGKTDRAMICLLARSSASTSGQAIGDAFAPWSKRLSSAHEIAKPIQSTLWSPPIMSGTLGCLVFTYRYWSGPLPGKRQPGLSSRQKTVNGSPHGFSLALLRRQAG